MKIWRENAKSRVKLLLYPMKIWRDNGGKSTENLGLYILKVMLEGVECKKISGINAESRVKLHEKYKG